MTTRRIVCFQKLALGLGGGVLIAVWLGCGCGKPGKSAPPPRTKETLAFWDRFNKAAVFGTGVESLRWPAYQGPVAARDTYAVLGDILGGEQMRSRTITSLPRLRVEPDLVAYALEFARSRMELAGLVQDYVELAKDQEDLAGKPFLGGGLLGELLHRPEVKPDGIIWAALSTQAAQTSRSLQRLREPANAIEAKVALIRGGMAQLNQRETNVRDKLARKYGGHLSPLEDYVRAAAARTKENQIFENQIVMTLLGRTVGGMVDGWTFESPQEFVSLKILSATNHSDLLADYDVQASVRGARTGAQREFKLHLSYGRLYTRWVLLDMKPLK